MSPGVWVALEKDNEVRKGGLLEEDLTDTQEKVWKILFSF